MTSLRATIWAITMMLLVFALYMGAFAFSVWVHG